MKKTGKINPITGKEIYRAEECDINFWDNDWGLLSLDQKATFCSLIGALFLGEQNELEVEEMWNVMRIKHV